MRAIICWCLIALSMPNPSFADGDPVNGKSVFTRCSPCHYPDVARNKMGPHLLGISGRKAGSLADYPAYSQAMKEAGEQGMIWDDETLTRFLSSPKKAVPGTSMRFFGLWSEQEVADVIAYLKSSSENQ